MNRAPESGPVLPGDDEAQRVENRKPPHNLDAEAAVLSAVLVDPNAHDQVIDFLEARHFYSEAHRRIYEAAVEVQAEGKPIDIVTVATWLRDHQRLPQVGGMAYMTEILNAAPAVTNVGTYGRIVYDLARTREAIALSQQIVAVGYAGTVEPARFVDYAEGLIGGLADRDQGTDTGAPLGKVLEGTYAGISNAYSQGVAPGISTGLIELDELTLGMHRKELTILAARPGMGKTAALLTIARNVAGTIPLLFDDDTAKARPQAVAIFSLEMRRDKLAMRLLAAESGVNLRALRSGKLEQADWGPLTDAAAKLSGLHIHIDDTPHLHVARLASRIRRLKRAYAEKGADLSVVMVDYLTRLHGDDAGSREREVAQISTKLAITAIEEDVVLIAAAQLSRGVEQRAQGARRPVLSDLRESGQIEQDAQNVIFLYRPDIAGEQVAPEERGTCEWIVAKQRDGETGTANSRYIGRITKFENPT